MDWMVMMVPLFVALAPDIIEALNDIGHEFPPGVAPEQVAWVFMCQRAVLLKQGRRVNTCRFGALSHAMGTNIPMLPMQLFERTFVGLEEDFLGSKVFTQKLTSRMLEGQEIPEGGQQSQTAITTTVQAEQQQQQVHHIITY